MEKSWKETKARKRKSLTGVSLLRGLKTNFSWLAISSSLLGQEKENIIHMVNFLISLRNTGNGQISYFLIPTSSMWGHYKILKTDQSPQFQANFYCLVNCAGNRSQSISQGEVNIKHKYYYSLKSHMCRNI